MSQEYQCGKDTEGQGDEGEASPTPRQCEDRECAHRGLRIEGGRKRSKVFGAHRWIYERARKLTTIATMLEAVQEPIRSDPQDGGGV